MRASRGWVGLLLLATLPAAAADQDPYEACAEQLADQPDAESAARCFLETADVIGDRPRAIALLEQQAEVLPVAPWRHYYLGELRLINQLCGAPTAAAYDRAAELFADRAELANASRAWSALALVLRRCQDPLWEEALYKADEAASQSGDRLSLLRVAAGRLQIEVYSGTGELAAATDALRGICSEVQAPAFDHRSRIFKTRQRCLEILLEACNRRGREEEARSLEGQLGEFIRSRRDQARADLNKLILQLRFKPPSAGNRRFLIAELEQLSAVLEELDYKEAEATARRSLARLQGGSGAIVHLQRCLQLAGELGDQRLDRSCRLAEARWWLRDDPRQASWLLDQITTEPPLSEDPWSLIDGWPERLEILRQSRSLAAALEAGGAVLDALEAIRSSQTGLAREELLHAWSDPYYVVAGWLLQDPTEADPRRAFAVIERLRAQHLREILLLGDPENAPLLALPAADLLDQVSAGLAKNQAMLSFQIGLEEDLGGQFLGGSWLLVATRRQVRSVRLSVDRADLEGAVEKLGKRTEGEWSAATWANLHASLLGDALDQLPATIERLLIIPDGVLHLLPFAALRTAEGGLTLAERYSISIVPSAELWLHWQGAEQSVDLASVLAFADPLAALGSAVAEQRSGGSGVGLGPLPHAYREGRAIVRHLPGTSRLISGAAATEDALKTTDLSPFSMLHFATHAVADDDPQRSRVQLARGAAEDGQLHLDEIAELDLEGKVVVLSVCNSAAGRWLRGAGVMSLARAFFAAGAQAVVGTLRPLPDKQGRLFFDGFYAQLSRGLSLSQALAATQRRWAARGEPESTWANVVVFGNGDLVPVPGGVDPPGRWLISAAGLLLLGVLGGLLARHRWFGRPRR